jgi:8-oxo-dGTP pyrophosphatase MutT (NUDIX family)
MPTPEFVLALREKIGHDPLWLAGVTAVVVHGTRVLLVRRSDNGAWTPVTGIVDPGEHPAVAAVREVLEEAGVVAEAEVLAWTGVTDLITYENGDQTQYIDLTFRCGYIDGDPFPADGENTEAAWFPIDQLPEMTPEMRGRIRHALAASGEARFAV